jgi:hypothetical protein
MFDNSDPVNCPIIDYRIHQLFTNGQREWGSVRDVITINDDDKLQVDEDIYRGEKINARIWAMTNARAPVEREISVTEKIIKQRICIEQTVRVVNSTEFVMNAAH